MAKSNSPTPRRPSLHWTEATKRPSTRLRTGTCRIDPTADDGPDDEREEEDPERIPLDRLFR